MKKIIIEVGSNNGSDTRYLLDDDTIIYCFEPNHILYCELYEKYKYNDNVFVFPFAVDLYSKFSKFNVQTVANMGCSSLNEYNRDIKNEWPDRTDFSFGDSYIVPTISLKDFIQIYNIDRIDYLWIDAQGSDFNILQGLGDKINIVKKGRCEASYNVSLYEVNNHYSDISRYLQSAGFKCELITDESGIDAECDIYFNRGL